MKTLPTTNLQKLNAMMCDLHEISRAKILNGIEQMYEQHSLPNAEYERIPEAQLWNTKRIKALPEWAKISDPQKLVVSSYMDWLCMEAQDLPGCIHPKGLKSYYKPDHKDSTPIMPAKLLMV